MTSAEKAQNEREIQIAFLADSLFDTEGDTDYIGVYEALAPFLSRADHVALGAMLELCPDHYCDIDICRDDGIHGYEVYDLKEATTT